MPAPHGGSAPAGDLPYRLYAEEGADHYPPQVLAATHDQVDVVLCVRNEDIPVSQCNYRVSGGQASGGTFSVPVVRRDRIVSLVNAQTGQIFAEQRFNGGAPTGAICPASNPPGTITGSTAYTPDWRGWVVSQLNGSAAGNDTLRTLVNTSGLNARAEPNTSSAIITQLAYDTPVNLIARNNAGDWAVALLPDMQRAWLYVPLLRVSMLTDVAALPVVDGPADAVGVPVPAS
jgi:hypothetical protein